MQRSFKVEIVGVDNPQGREIVFRYRDDTYDTIVGDWGRTVIDFPHNWVSEILVDGTPIPEWAEKEIGGRENLGTIKIREEKTAEQGFPIELIGDSSQISKAKIMFFYQGRTFDTLSDEQGRAQMPYRYSWVDRITVNGKLIEEDVDLSGKKGLRFKLDKAGERPEQKQRFGIHGQIFYANGIMVAESHQITAFVHGERYTTKSNSDGTFHLEIISPSYDGSYKSKKANIEEFYVNGNPIAKGQRARDNEKFYHIVLPKEMTPWGGTSDRGGMVAGRAVDSKGLPLVDTKITAEIISSGFFSSGETFSTRTGKKGQFVLRFEGGTRIKKMYIGNDEPRDVNRRTKDGDEPVAKEDLKAGLFDLSLVRKDKFLGIF